MNQHHVCSWLHVHCIVQMYNGVNHLDILKSLYLFKDELLTLLQTDPILTITLSINT